MTRTYRDNAALMVALRRSYARLQDNVLSTDMAWWFNDRRDNLRELRRMETPAEVLGLAGPLLDYVRDYYDPEDEGDAEELARLGGMVSRWLRRWSSARVRA